MLYIKVENTGTVLQQLPASIMAMESSKSSRILTACSGESPKCLVRPQNTYAFHIGGSPSQILCFQSSANWKLDESTTSCNHVRKDRASTLLLHLGTKSAVPYIFSGNAFCRWIGTEDETAVGPNYLAVLTLWWCYILSASLVEIQGQDGTMRHTESKAPGYYDLSRETTSSTSAIDIGEADYETMSWWSSILAPGGGLEGCCQSVRLWRVSCALVSDECFQSIFLY